MHEVAYEAVSRHIGNLTPSASISMREAAGQSIKSAVSHSWIRDTRDDKLVGTRDRIRSCTTNLRASVVVTRRSKTEAQTQLSRSLVPGVTVSFAARSGLLWSLARPAPFF
ncbi:hypothetical protein A0H81_02056 [Grifola frondosa]|uniref:Uncharacterized protein n=1 Tax=Grifola frondosa TaxID=5627 RepID=A0A1C7MSH7_GRIFR|nr:hypothetical protein A0H81_02056 [Grifola frondosa]